MKNKDAPDQAARDYELIEKTVHYLSRRGSGETDLKALARSLSLRPLHLQRMFRRWAGMTPEQFFRFLSLQHAKALLLASKESLEAFRDEGCYGPGRRLHPFLTLEAVTLREFKNGRQRVTIAYGFHPTRFGPCLIAVTGRGICHLSFGTRQNGLQALKALSNQWENARLVRNQDATGSLIRQIFHESASFPARLFLKGTKFQIEVWKALLRIPQGAVVSYEDLAVTIRKPGSARAVSRAVASNPIAYLIPCHRVIHKSGEMAGYRWNTERKIAMLAWESGRA